MHATSSRRHAMLFHHSNGACYVVDCGSAHGTFVNGKRIASPAVTGVVVPHKVRRGSLIRFGGPGAPAFVLKSFNFFLSEINSEDPEDAALLVRRNTRLNALGKTAAESVLQRQSLFDALTVARKRSFDSLSSRDTLDLDEPEFKRMRCSSPPLSPEMPMRLVSPDLPTMSASKQRHVTFSCDPPQAFYPITITPEESGDEDNRED
jgi:FHA domain